MDELESEGVVVLDEVEAKSVGALDELENECVAAEVREDAEEFNREGFDGISGLIAG